MQRISSFTSGKTAQVVESAINDSAYDVVKIVSDDIAHVTAVSTAIGDGTFTKVDIVTTEPFKSNIGIVSGINGAVTTVAGLITQVTALSDVVTSTALENLSGNSADLVALSGNSADLTALGGNSANLSLLGTLDAVSDMNTLAVPAIITDMDVVSTDIGSVTTVATDLDKLTDSAILNALTNATNSANSATDSANSATNAQLSEWEAEASRLTATSYAVEAENVLVNLVTSNGDGTYTYTPQTGVYSSLHYESKTAAFDPALYQTRNEEGVANGYASLDSAGLVPASQLPSYVDDVIEVATYADLPLGTIGFIYIVVADETKGGDTSTYRWTGSVYALVSNTLTSLDVKNLYEGNTDTNVYTDTEKAQVAAIDGIGGGQFVGAGLAKGIQFMAHSSVANESMTIVTGTNGFSIDSFELLNGASLTIEDGATYKVL